MIALTGRQRRMTVLLHVNRISLLYSLAPLLLVKDVARELDFTHSLDHCLHRDRNRTLLILRYFEGMHLHNRRVDLKLMARLREKYDRIAFFDDGDGAGCTRFEVLPYVDLYFKKQLFRDLSTYQRNLYGRELHTDYYHQRFGVADAQPHYRRSIDPNHKSKLRVAWNLGVGSYPISAPVQRIGTAAARLASERLGFLAYRHPLQYRAENRNLYQVHARFTVPDSRPSVFFQRRLLLRRIAGCPQFLAGPVSPRRYQREIRHAKLTLSPFGWGEICFRDFEAVLNDSLLLKPNMEHLATWPDIYRPKETYIPIEWDASDVVERAQHYLEDVHARRQIAANAKDVYYDSLRSLRQRVHAVVEWILGTESQPSHIGDLRAAPGERLVAACT